MKGSSLSANHSLHSYVSSLSVLLLFAVLGAAGERQEELLNYLDLRRGNPESGMIMWLQERILPGEVKRAILTHGDASNEVRAVSIRRAIHHILPNAESRKDRLMERRKLVALSAVFVTVARFAHLLLREEIL